MNRKIRTVIGTVGCLILCIFGVYRLLEPSTTAFWIPLLFAVSGLIGVIGNIIELKKLSSSTSK